MPAMPNFIRLCEGVTVDVTVDATVGFQIPRRAGSPSYRHRSTKAILINSPANPTGTLLSPTEMARIAELGPLVISDEYLSWIGV